MSQRGTADSELKGPSIFFCFPPWLFNSFHTMLFSAFKRDEVTSTIESWFAQKETVIWGDDGNDEDIDFVSYFPI